MSRSFPDGQEQQGLSRHKEDFVFQGPVSILEWLDTCCNVAERKRGTYDRREGEFATKGLECRE